jgi:DNA polymerase-3 subunit gamma/tau
VSGGLAAARAAAANAGRGGSVAAAPAPTSPATTSPAGSRAAVTTPAANGSDRWADGSPAAEAPYDPEYDGPAAEFEGFGPDDEPLEGVIIDEKTARMNGEQKAVKLLQDAFGAEKIGEI